MQHDPELMLERLRQSSEAAIQRGTLQIEDARLLISHLRASLDQTTYLQG
jgi:arginine decarboxylase